MTTDQSLDLQQSLQVIKNTGIYLFELKFFKYIFLTYIFYM